MRTNMTVLTLMVLAAGASAAQERKITRADLPARSLAGRQHRQIRVKIELHDLSRFQQAIITPTRTRQ